MTSSEPDPQRSHPTDPAVMECPFGYYAQLHADPARAFDEGPAGTVVPGYQDLAVLSRDPGLSNEFHGPDGMKLMGISPEPYSPEVQAVVDSMHPMANVLLFADPPTHTRTRALATKALNAGRVRKLEPMIQEKVDGLIDAFVEAGECDWVAQFAARLPIVVMGELLGIDDADMEKFARWSSDTVRGVGDTLDNEQRLVVGQSVLEFQAYVLERVAQRRETRTDDLLDSIVHAELTQDDLTQDGDEITGPRTLDDSEIVSIVIQLIAGGTHTTAGLLGSTMSRLLQHPDVMAEVRADPALVRNLIDETLRIGGPIQFSFRIATEPVSLGDAEVPVGTMLSVGWGATGHDPSVFVEPERFDIHRENGRKHMSFGHGRHFCVGSHLARAEVTAAITTALRRMDEIELDGDSAALRHHPSFTFRSLVALPIRFTAAAAAETPA